MNKEYTQEEVDAMSDEEYREYLKGMVPENVSQVYVGETKMIMFTTFDASQPNDYDDSLKRLITIGELDYFKALKEANPEQQVYLPNQVANLDELPEQLAEVVRQTCETYESTSVVLRFWEQLPNEDDEMHWYPVQASL